MKEGDENQNDLFAEFGLVDRCSSLEFARSAESDTEYVSTVSYVLKIWGQRNFEIVVSSIMFGKQARGGHEVFSFHCDWIYHWTLDFGV